MFKERLFHFSQVSLYQTLSFPDGEIVDIWEDHIWIIIQAADHDFDFCINALLSKLKFWLVISWYLQSQTLYIWLCVCHQNLVGISHQSVFYNSTLACLSLEPEHVWHCDKLIPMFI